MTTTPDSVDGEAAAKSASNLLFVLAVLNAGLGLVAEMLAIEPLLAAGIGIGTIVIGAIYAGLGAWARGGARAPIVIAIAILVVDAGLTIAASVQAGEPPAAGGLVVRGFIIVALVRALRAPRGSDDARERAPRARSSSLAAPAGAPVSPELAQKKLAVAAATASYTAGALPPRHGKEPIASRPGMDKAAKALRFVATKVEILDAGLRVTGKQLQQSDVPWSAIVEMSARQLPVDPPFDAKIVLDLVVQGAPEPVRIFPTTAVNFGALPSGAGAGFVDNLRRLACHIGTMNPTVGVDDATRGFALENKPAQRFAALSQFLEYDARFS